MQDLIFLHCIELSESLPRPSFVKVVFFFKWENMLIEILVLFIKSFAQMYFANIVFVDFPCKRKNILVLIKSKGVFLFINKKVNSPENKINIKRKHLKSFCKPSRDRKLLSVSTYFLVINRSHSLQYRHSRRCRLRDQVCSVKFLLSNN